jgi:lactate racemase
MNVDLAYGNGVLPVVLPADRTSVIEPTARIGVADENAALIQSLFAPIGSLPLRDRIRPSDRVCILFTDSTRATPNDRLIPWLLEHLGDHPRENILLVNQLGTHRPNTRAELETMLTPEVVANYEVVNHDCHDESGMVAVGEMRDGTLALLNRRAVEADLRIVTGFIEPHFFAGFSGGPKGLMPGVAALRTVMSNHGYRNISDPNATFGITHGNPLWEELLRIAKLAGPTFLINVTLNEGREITDVYSGDLEAAHATGCRAVKHTAMQPVKEPFDIVLTTNSGYPLDQNLYQGVKGMTAASRIVKPGGMIILACECSDGVPAASPFEVLLGEAGSAEEILGILAAGGPPRAEQWQAQLQALVQRKAEIHVYSGLPDAVVRECHLTPCSDIGRTIRERLKDLPADAKVAVMPQGPLTIPYLEG